MKRNKSKRCMNYYPVQLLTVMATITAGINVFVFYPVMLVANSYHPVETNSSLCKPKERMRYRD